MTGPLSVYAASYLFTDVDPETISILPGLTAYIGNAADSDSTGFYTSDESGSLVLDAEQTEDFIFILVFARDRISADDVVSPYITRFAFCLPSMGQFVPSR